MNSFPFPPEWALAALRAGLVIPAHPLALAANRRLDERRQQALTRYYHAAGAGGIAVGVHTTQFAIRDAKHGLLEPVLRLAAETIAACDAAAGVKTVRIAGIVGATPQAIAEGRLAVKLGYHVGLLSLSALKEENNDALIEHCQAVAREIPLFGFYLQPGVGGRLLDESFWRRFAGIPNAVAIKIACFNRYQTLEVARAVADAGRAGEIALYTGNDDSILLDLLTELAFATPRGLVRLGFAGGLLGHWAYWTRAAVEQLAATKRARQGGAVPGALLTLAAQVTEANAAIFDAPNHFAGCLPGIQEVLRRQGFLENACCLDEAEKLSSGQSAAIDRVERAYPHLRDDEFVKANLHRWLG